MKRYGALVAVLLLLFAVAACQNKGSDSAQADSPVIAEINEEKITQAQFDKYMKMEIFNYQMSLLGMIQEQNPDVDSLPEVTPQIEEQLKNDVFEQLVNMVLINQEGSKQKITIKNEELESAYKKMLQSKSQDAYEQWLQGTGLDENDTKYILKTQLIYDKLTAELKKQIKVSEVELRAYYDENNAKQLEISHILVDSEAEANKVLALINNGADFAETARQYSTCPSKDQGGALGSATTGKWVKAFEEAALQLKAGEITTKPVKTEFGYHIIKADAAKSFEASRNSIQLKLQNQKEQEAQMNFLENSRNDAKIIDYRTN